MACAARFGGTHRRRTDFAVARTHGQYQKDDRSKDVSLSKIAHMRQPRSDSGTGSNRELQCAWLTVEDKYWSSSRSIEPHWRMRIGQVEFPPTVEADAIRSMLDGEDPAEVPMPATKDGSKQRKQFHRSCARWRRSQLPLASSQSSNARTL